jgi:hypothetical protein
MLEEGMGSWSFIGWLSSLSLTGVILFVLISLILASLAGYAVRQIEQRRASRRKEKVEHSQESYLVGSMLGLLALLLAFSFSMALDRYEERRHLVVQEANAIGTAYLRAQMLDEPHRSRLSGLLVEYTDNRIELASAAVDRGKPLLARNDRLLTDIWAAVAASRESALRHGITTALLMTYNEVIDLDTERKVARQMRVPTAVLQLLYGFLIMTALVLGYVLEERRGRMGAGVLFLILSLYIGIISDLSRPAAGSIIESQEPMLMLRQSMKAQPPAAFDRFRDVDRP